MATAKPLTAGQRRALGALAILVYLPVYVALAVELGGRTVSWPWWAQATFFAVAGLAWVAPLYPLFRWMGGRS